MADETGQTVLTALPGLALPLAAALAALRASLPAPDATAETRLVFQALGAAAGGDGDPLAVLAEAFPEWDPAFEPSEAAAAVLAGVGHAAAWNELRPRLARALNALAPRFARPEFAAMTLRLVDRSLAAGGGQGRFGALFIARFDPDTPPADLVPPEGTERLVGILAGPGGETGRFEIAPRDVVRAGELAALLDELRLPVGAPTNAGLAQDAPPDSNDRLIAVLMYHRIADDPVPALGRYATRPAEFARQMRALADEGCHVLGLDEMEAILWGGAAVPPRSVLLTFDDAYRDTFTEALPILRDHAFRATLFVPTSHVGAAAGWDALFGPPAPLATWSEIARMQAGGFDIAAHGQRHRPMAALGPAALVEELAGARHVLADRLGTDVTALAYPYGAVDEAVARAALAAGYHLGFTTEDRVMCPQDRVMLIPRVEIARGLTRDDWVARVVNVCSRT